MMDVLLKLMLVISGGLFCTSGAAYVFAVYVFDVNSDIPMYQKEAEKLKRIAAISLQCGLVAVVIIFCIFTATLVLK